MPILAAFGAAALHVYPFEPRVVLFLFPAFLLLTAAGPEAIGRLAGSRRLARRHARRGRRAPRSPLLGLAAESAALRARAARAGAPDDAPGVAARRPCLRLLRRGEGVPLLRAAVRHSRPRTTSSGAAPGRTRASTCASSTRSAAGPRTWLVVTHAVPEETTAIRSYLDRIGTRRASFEAGNAPGTRRSDRARVDLYDLSDPARLATVTADAFPMPPPAGGGRRPPGPATRGAAAGADPRQPSLPAPKPKSGSGPDFETVRRARRRPKSGLTPARDPVQAWRASYLRGARRRPSAYQIRIELRTIASRSRGPTAPGRVREEAGLLERALDQRGRVALAVADRREAVGDADVPHERDERPRQAPRAAPSRRGPARARRGARPPGDAARARSRR